MEQALAGFRVLEFGSYIPGPYAAMLLAEQGAEVVKVERPGGDPMRKEPGFVVWNRSKKGITLDLKTSEGKRAAHELAKRSDVVVENFRPGVADRLGIGYETVRGLNPRAVYCSISGFGPDGPNRDVPGWDPIVASTAGVYVDQAGIGAPPLYIVLPLPSYYASVMAALSITTALCAREITGKGQKVDISLFNAMVYAESYNMSDFEGKVRIPSGEPQGSLPLYRLYQGSDGKWFGIGVASMPFFTKLALAMEHPEWLADPLFEGAPFLIFPPRSGEVIRLLQEIFSTKTRDEWLKFLRAADIPCDPAQPIADFLEDPQVMANGMVQVVEEPKLGKVRQMGVPVKLRAAPGRVKGPSPVLGQHTEEVLSGLGYSKTELAALKRQGVI